MKARPRKDPAAATFRWPTLLSVLSGNALLLLANLSSGVLTARALGPSGRGEFAATVSWCTAASVVLTLGVTQAVVVHRGEVNWLRRWLLIQVAVSAVLGATLVLVLQSAGAHSWLGVSGVVGGAVWCAGAVASSLSGGWLQRYGKMGRPFQYARLAPQAVLIASMSCLWAFGVANAAAWFAIAGGLSGLCAVLVLVRNLRCHHDSVTVANRRGDRRGFVGLAAGALVVTVGAQVIYRLDALVVAVSFEAEQVGYYAVALGAGGVCYALGIAAGMLMFSQLPSMPSPYDRRRLILHAVARAVAISGVACVPALLFTSQLIRLVYGAGFTPATMATRIILLASVILAADYVLVHAVLGLGAKRYLVLVQFIVGGLTIVLLLPAASTGDLAQVALVSLLVYPLSTAMHLVVVVSKTRPRALGGEAIVESH